MAFLIAEITYVYYMLTTGVSAFAGLKTLGSKQQGMVMDESLGIFVVQKGDNSMLILLSGVVTLFVTVIFIVLFRASIKAGQEAQVLNHGLMIL